MTPDEFTLGASGTQARSRGGRTCRSRRAGPGRGGRRRSRCARAGYVVMITVVFRLADQNERSVIRQRNRDIVAVHCRQRKGVVHPHLVRSGTILDRHKLLCTVRVRSRYRLQDEQAAHGRTGMRRIRSRWNLSAAHGQGEKRVIRPGSLTVGKGVDILRQDALHYLAQLVCRFWSDDDGRESHLTHQERGRTEKGSDSYVSNMRYAAVEGVGFIIRWPAPSRGAGEVMFAILTKTVPPSTVFFSR